MYFNSRSRRKVKFIEASIHICHASKIIFPPRILDLKRRHSRRVRASLDHIAVRSARNLQRLESCPPLDRSCYGMVVWHRRRQDCPIHPDATPTPVLRRPTSRYSPACSSLADSFYATAISQGASLANVLIRTRSPAFSVPLLRWT